MSDKVYKGDEGTEIIVDCGEDISAATDQVLKVYKPVSLAEVEWAASIYNTNYLKHTIVTDDLDEVGVYKIQPYMTLSGWTGRGKTTNLYIYDHYG